MIFLSVFFDTIGIGLIIPIVNLMIDNDLVSKYPFFSPIIEMLGNPNKEKLLIYLIIFLLIIFLIKNIFLGILTWKKNYFTYSIGNYYSKQLLSIYLKKPYSFHVNTNSSKLVNNLINETSLASGQFILSLIDIVLESLVLLSLFALLLLVEPMVTFLMFIIFIFFSFTYFFLVKKKVLEYGYLRQSTNTERLKLYTETLTNIKFFLIYKKTKKIISKIINNLEKIKMFNVGYIFLQNLPRLLFEYIIIVIFCLVISGYIYSEFLLIENLVPSLALFSAAAFRMLPSTNKIILRIQNLKYAKSAIELISNELKKKDNNRHLSIKNLNLKFEKLTLKNVAFKYESKKNFIFKDISLDIKKGKIYGFFGMTGSGKTTLSDLIMGLQKINSGKILLNDGKDLHDCINSWQNIIGYVPQKIFLDDDTIKNNIAFGEFDNEIDQNKLNECIKLAQLSDFVEKLDEGINTFVGESGSKLSGGQVQRVGIARALYNNPQILVLDEITSSLDVDTEKEIIDVIKNLKGKKTIILITHRLNILQVCDEIFEVNNGLLTKK